MDPAPALSHVQGLEALVKTVQLEELPRIVGELARLQAIASCRLAGSPPPEPNAEPACNNSDRLLSADEAADILGVGKRWLYRHHREIPGSQKLSRNCLRFSERKLLKWMSTKRA